MDLGLIWGYWGRGMPEGLIERTVAAETAGYAAVWTAESWGSDAFSPLAMLAGHTSRIRLATGVVQLAARTPTATAMHAITLDHLSNGRFTLGLGVSGPQVVEGWYGQPSRKPLARTREYIDIIRQVVRRDGPLEYAGEFYQHPRRGEGTENLGKPLKVMTHALREFPIFIGAEGPKNVAQTAEIADGWLPLYYSPYRPEVYADQIKGAKPGFEIAVHTTVSITDDVETALWPVKASLGFYIGGMGAKGQNYHTKLMGRMGYEKEALAIQDLFFEGKRDEAIAMVPSEFADEISLVGSPERIRDRLAAWRESPVTMINVSASSIEQINQIAEIFAE